MAAANMAADAVADPAARPAITDRSRAKLQATLAFLVRCGSAGLLYLTQVALARWMGASEYGVYVSVWTTVMILGGVGGLGLNLGVMRLVAVHREARDLAGLRGLHIGSRWLALATGTLLAVCAFALVGTVPMSDSHRAAAAVALICLPLYAVADVQDGLGRGHGWIMAALVPPYILRPASILAIMAGVYLAGGPMSASSAAMAAVAAVAFAMVVQAVWLGAKLVRFVGRGPSTYAPRAWLASSLPLLAIAAAELALQNIDVIVLSAFASPAEVATYFAAAKTMSLMMFVHYAVGSAMAARFAALKERGDRAGLQAAVGDAVAWTFWPSIVVAVAILVLGKPLLSFFGPGFVESYPIMAILVAGFVVRSAMGPAETLLNMLGEQRACARAMGAAAIIGLVLNLMLVPCFGGTGAAIATASALAAVGVLTARAAKTRLGLDVAIWRNIRAVNLCKSPAAT